MMNIISSMFISEERGGDNVSVRNVKNLKNNSAAKKLSRDYTKFANNSSRTKFSLFDHDNIIVYMYLSCFNNKLFCVYISEKLSIKKVFLE